MKSIRKNFVITLLFLILTLGSCLTAYAANPSNSISIPTLKEGDILTSDNTLYLDLDELGNPDFEFENGGVQLIFQYGIGTVEGTPIAVSYPGETMTKARNSHVEIPLNNLTERKKYVISSLTINTTTRMDLRNQADGGSQKYSIAITLEEYVAPAPVAPAQPSAPVKATVVPTEPAETTVTRATHAHSFNWVETVSPTETSDGLMEYRCSCGVVEDKMVLSGSMSFVKNIVYKIQNAPADSTVEINTNNYTCYTDFIMSALRKRTDVSLKTTFKDKDGSTKAFTIPAGQAPDDEQLFYGFTYLGNLYGWN